MPASRAELLCPNAVFLPPDFPRYRAASREVREIFKRHTELIEPLSLDEAYLDVSENKTGLPTATQVARTIREQIRDELRLTASAGVAPNKFLAKIASDWKKPDGLFVIQPEEVDSFLLPLPVNRLPGVGKVTEEKLKHLEVHTIADLRQMDLHGIDFTLSDMVEVNFTDADLRGAQLAGVNLYGANLHGADLRGANLEGANLEDSGLIDAVMREANLKGANLAGADLFGADLTGANLTGADLSESRLSRAILTDAKLDGANFKGALMPDGSVHE